MLQALCVDCFFLNVHQKEMQKVLVPGVAGVAHGREEELRRRLDLRRDRDHHVGLEDEEGVVEEEARHERRRRLEALEGDDLAARFQTVHQFPEVATGKSSACSKSSTKSWSDSSNFIRKALCEK